MCVLRMRPRLFLLLAGILKAEVLGATTTTSTTTTTTPTTTTTTPSSDPLPGLFVRQESAIRKLDALTAKISKLDALEDKMERVLSLLQQRETKLSALVEEMIGKVGKMEENIVKVELEVKGVKEKIDIVEERVEEIGDKVEIMDGRLGEIVEAVEMNITQVSEEEEEEMTANRTSVRALSEITSLLHNLTEAVEEEAKEGIQRNMECRRQVEEVKALIKPAINTTHHLAAALVNRIRVSNLAMDKRLGAILHAMSLRHGLLQESIRSQINAVDTNIVKNIADGFEMVGNKIEGIEDVILDGERNIIDVVNATTTTATATATATATTTTPLDIQEELQSLSSILQLSNLTLTLLQEKEEEEEEEEEEGKRMCVLMEADVTTNTTTTTTNTNTTQLKDTMREVLRERLAHIEEQLSGLRIYLSTSLHLHANQVEDRMAGVEGALLRAVQDTLNKSNRGLEKLRRSSLGYLDAAVTSISSAAVASAQATSDHLTKALKDVTLTLTRRMNQVEMAIRGEDSEDSDSSDWERWWWWWWCPNANHGNGSGIGSGSIGTCIGSLPTDGTDWTASRTRCKAIGGDLLTTTPTPRLRPLYTNTYSLPTPSYWLGGRRVLGEWRWVTGELVEGEIREGEKDGECLVLTAGEDGVKMSSSPCHTNHPALCQLPAASADPSTLPLNPETNEVTPIEPHRFLTPGDLILA